MNIRPPNNELKAGIYYCHCRKGNWGTSSWSWFYYSHFCSPTPWIFVKHLHPGLTPEHLLGLGWCQEQNPVLRLLFLVDEFLLDYRAELASSVFTQALRLKQEKQQKWSLQSTCKWGHRTALLAVSCHCPGLGRVWNHMLRVVFWGRAAILAQIMVLQGLGLHCRWLIGVCGSTLFLGGLKDLSDCLKLTPDHVN